VEFLVYGRDRPGTADLRWQLVEEHWSYMDRFADSVIARGPTLTPDRETATGSLHIVDLAGPAAALAFAHEEPNYRAGVYQDVLIRRFVNVLGGTMWDFPGRDEDNRYLIIAHARPGAEAPQESLDATPMIVCGPLLADDGDTWLGTAVLAETPDPGDLLDPAHYDTIEIHPWQFGGRR
jgi:uncharacterized protein YciI